MATHRAAFGNPGKGHLVIQARGEPAIAVFRRLDLVPVGCSISACPGVSKPLALSLYPKNLLINNGLVIQAGMPERPRLGRSFRPQVDSFQTPYLALAVPVVCCGSLPSKIASRDRLPNGPRSQDGVK